MPINQNEFKLLRDYIETHCGITVGDEKVYLVESRLSGLMVKFGCATFEAFYRMAVADGSLGLRDKIVDAMTTNETLWFRDVTPFKVMEEVLLRKMADEIQQGKRKRIRIWCAACSTGQEPYSLAMTLHEFGRKFSVLPMEYTEIFATDISPSALFLAMAGRYDKIAISRGLSEEMRARYFDPAGPVWALKDKVKKMVTFKKLNLQVNLNALGRFDIIFCRNVAIYFSETFKKNLFRRMAQLLRPDGYLFLGASESISGYSAEYRMLTHEKGMYYQVKQEGKP